jgi:hypothetical protein
VDIGESGEAFPSVGGHSQEAVATTAADRADRAEASFFGRKARLLPERGRELNALGAKQPDLTLAQIKERLRLACTIPAIHQVLAKLGINYQKDAQCG